MTQNTVTHNTKTVTQVEFLETLYPQLPEGLYLELRCIHPETGEVRTRWAKVENEKQRDSVLKQAEKLNHEGYGVYYAPCLRQTKQGKAEAAALVPALWVDIDCDDDPVRREAGLVALHGFVLQPSAILNSGGGWHAYWLLDTPFTLQNDDDRQRIARLLHGLFSALDGDPGYVKSVASVMRLPGSANTKPGRNHAPVEIVEWQPERRYPLRDFDWLDVTPPKPERIGKLEIITLNGNGHHPLPPRTEAYLTSGAPLEQRNKELFAAACQLRDAGYSQRDAEGELVARYLADSNGSENPVGREKEARATVASAFSQSPREPITASKEHARQVVNQLVGQYQVERKSERPTTQQVIEAVKACVHLNAVEWAEQREKFKALTGDGLKISDIDRLYREKRKTIERQRQQEYVDTESYLLLDGKIVYRKESYRGVVERTVADWAATALYQTCQVDDDGKEAHVTTIELQRGTSVKKLEVPGEVFVDDVALRRFIGANAGVQYVVRAGMSKHLVPAIVQLSGEFPTHRHYNFMGWMELDGRWVYVSPQECVTATGKLAEPPSVELDQRLRDYGLQTTEWRESLAAFDAVTKVLPSNLAPALLAFALLPVIQRFFPDAATKPAVHLVGTSGSGKSEIASLLSSFYGQFSRDTPPAQWGDTINMVEMLGYPLADALYWVDDYKDIYADTRTFTRFLQSYSRNLGRGRLTREAKLQTSRPCRGLILSTGETSLERELSVSSRMMALEIPPWKQRDPGGQALREAEALRDRLPGFTAHFASWVACQLDGDDFRMEIAGRFSQNLKGYTAKVTAALGKANAHDRAVKNWAVLVTVYQALSNFIDAMDGDYLLPAWQDCIVETVRSLREERASEVFLNVLGQLIGSGQCLIEPSLRVQGETAPGHTVVGYRDESFLYLLPDVALREVNKVQPLSFSSHAIGSQLREDGLLLPGKINLTVQKSVRGSVIRLWRLKSEVLGCEGCETCEDGC
ncbi:MAG: DUF927 domain-containing protein [Anaerolineaceae bacterium]|nr:DUF927 domain-containing protein [Anaerolineaceae bacterium]